MDLTLNVLQQEVNCNKRVSYSRKIKFAKQLIQQP